MKIPFLENMNAGLSIITACGRDLYLFFSGKITTKMLTKRCLCLLVSVVGPAGFGYGGTALGAAIGTILCPGVGTFFGLIIGGIVGVIAGIAVGKGIEALSDELVSDEAELNVLTSR